MRYEVTGESLTSVADAIRAKAGTTEAMEFPDGFVGAVDGIQRLDVEILERTVVNYRSTQTTKLGGGCFANCWDLVSVVCPNVTAVYGFAFQNCMSLLLLDCKATRIEWPFQNATNFETLILRGDSVATNAASDTFDSTKMANGTGFIYVPRSLVDSYKAATNWSTFASQIRAIEDYPEITGG